MSKFVDEIVKDIKANPSKWSKSGRYHANGIQKGNIIVYRVGNTAIFSVCDIEIDGLDIPMGYMDRYKIESIVNWWYKNASLSQLSQI